MKITAEVIKSRLRELAASRSHQIHYVVDLTAVSYWQRQAQLENIRTAIAACRDTKRALPPELSSIVAPLLTERGKLHSVERTTRSGKWRDRYGHEIEPIATSGKIKPEHFVVSFTVRPKDEFNHLIDLSEVPEEHRDEAFTLVKQLMKKTRVQRGNLPSHLQNTLLPVVETLIARRKVEEKRRNLEVLELQLRYLLPLERKPRQVERTALKKVKKLVKTKLAAAIEAHLANEHPYAVVQLFHSAKRHVEGGELLIQKGYPAFAAELYSMSGKCFAGAEILARDYPALARELFKEAERPLDGARILVKHAAQSRSHASFAAELYATAGKHEEGIAAMQKISRTDLVEELERHRKYSGESNVFRHATDEFRSARMARLRGEKPSKPRGLLRRPK